MLHAFTQPKNANPNNMSNNLSILISTSEAVQLRLEFAKSDDRWLNLWILVSGDNEFEIMTSVEGTPEQNWPPSPPLQDVNVHELPNGSAILGVGMAGKSHWSASLAGITENPEQTQFIRCEWACLSKDEQDRATAKAKLGSCFSVSSGFAFQQTGDRTEILSKDDQKAILTIEPIVGSQWSSKIKIDNDKLWVQPNIYSDSSVRSTQWGITVRIVDA